MSEKEKEKAAAAYYKEHPELRRFIQQERTRIDKSQPLSAADKEAIRAYEEMYRTGVELEQRPSPYSGKMDESYVSDIKVATKEREQLLEELEEDAFKKFVGEIHVPRAPTEKELEQIALASAERQYTVLHTYYLGKDIKITKDMDNAAHTICMTRPMSITIKGDTPEQKKTFDMDAPEKCVTFTFMEKKCVLDAEKAATEITKCAPIERVFACSEQTLNSLQASLLAKMNKKEAEKCVDMMFKQGAIFTVPHEKGFADKALGEDLFAMGKGVAAVVKSGVPIKYS